MFRRHRASVSSWARPRTRKAPASCARRRPADDGRRRNGRLHREVSMTGDPRSDLFFLPAWPPSADAVLWVSLTLVLAALLGEAVYRWLRLPRVVGYVAVGTIVSA